MRILASFVDQTTNEPHVFKLDFPEMDILEATELVSTILFEQGFEFNPNELIVYEIAHGTIH